MKYIDRIDKNFIANFLKTSLHSVENLDKIISKETDCWAVTYTTAQNVPMQIRFTDFGTKEIYTPAWFIDAWQKAMYKRFGVDYLKDSHYASYAERSFFD